MIAWSQVVCDSIRKITKVILSSKPTLNQTRDSPGSKWSAYQGARMVGSPERAFEEGKLLAYHRSRHSERQSCDEKVSWSQHTREQRISPAHFCGPVSDSEKAESRTGEAALLPIHLGARFLKRSIFNLLLSRSNACLCRVIEKYENRQSDKSLACEVKAALSPMSCARLLCT